MLGSIDAKNNRSAGVTSSELHPIRAQLFSVLQNRRSMTPLKLVGPGPNEDEVTSLLKVALRVPDHGALEPWRIILVKGSAREELASRLATSYLASHEGQDQATTELGLRKIKTVFATAPLVFIVVSTVDTSVRIPEWEQILSAGAVCMNLITAASVLGYGSIWLSGWAAYDPAALTQLGVHSGEKVAGIIPIGVLAEPPTERARPSLDKLVTTWVAT
jgi:nitroreductase